MIKFFRKIRQKLLSENKFSKYLIYAIGEIILVVIGILIALSINNWNEQNKENKIEHKYLERLVIDIAADSIHFEEKIKVAEYSKENLNEFIHKLYENQKSIEEVKELCTHLLINSDNLTIQNSTYKELINSGKINIFKNESLKESITEYYRINEDLIIEIGDFNLFSSQYLIEVGRVTGSFNKYFPFFKTIYNDSNMYLDGEWNFINDPKSEKFQVLEIMAGMYHLRNQEYLSHFNRLKSLSSKLKIKLEKELDSKIIE